MADLNCIAILFDLDGVLVHSAESVRRSWRRWAESNGFDAAVVEAAAHGRRTVDTIRSLAPELDAEQVAAELDEAQARDCGDVVVADGAHELVARLEPTEWAVVTSATRNQAYARIRAAGLPEPLVLVAGEDVTNGKPAPDGYLAAAARLGLAPASCVVIEDSDNGVQAARSAAMRVIGLANGGAGTRSTDLVVESCAELNVSRRPGEGIDKHIVLTWA
jgi:sugar-phosphatase